MIPRDHDAPAGLARFVSRVPVALLVCTVALGAGPVGLARAQDETSQLAAAEALFREGVALAKQERYAEAAAKFQASYTLDPGRGTLLGWAMAEERAGKLASALGHYQQLRDESRAAGDDEREEVARARITEIEPRVPTVTLQTEGPLPRGTRVLLDGEALPRGALGSALPLDPGEHRIDAKPPTGEVFSQTVALAEGDHETVTIELVSVEDPAPQPRPSRPRPREPEADDGGWSATRTGGFVLGAVGLVGLGAGGYLWLDAGRTYDEVEATCPYRICPPEQQSAIDEGRQKENIGRIALIAGGALAVTGLTLFITGGNDAGPAETETRLSLVPGAVTLTGRF